MIVEQIYATNKPRQNVWCKSSELQPSETPNAYELVDDAAAAKLGDGARIIVIDWPLTMLFWDKTAGVAYNWSDAEGGGKLTTLTADANDTYSPPAGYDGFSEVTVDVQPALQTLTATENDNYTPDEGYDGFSQVTVDVQPTLQTLTATENDIYTPDEGYDGFGEVSVNVPNPNTMTSITGTAAAPFGTIDPATLLAGISDRSAGATLAIAANTTLGTPEVHLAAMPAGSYLGFATVGGLAATVADSMVAQLLYDSSGTLVSALMLSGGSVTDMSAYGSILDTLLVVINHPMT